MFRVMRPHIKALLPTSTHNYCLQPSPQPLNWPLTQALPGDGSLPEKISSELVAPSHLWGSLPTSKAQRTPLRGVQKGREQRKRWSPAPLRRWYQDLRSLGAWACLLMRRKSCYSWEGGPPASQANPQAGSSSFSHRSLLPTS